MEAVERQARSTWPKVLNKIEMNDQGLVTITFSADVFFPGYIIRQYDSEYSFQPSQSNQEGISGIQQSLQGGESRLLTQQASGLPYIIENW